MIVVNGVSRDLAGLSVRGVLAELSMSDRGIAVAVNGDVVSRSQWDTTTIEDGAVIEVVTAVAGG